MEHAYLRSQLDRVLGLNTTRSKSICWLSKADQFFTAQANNVGVFNSTLSQVVRRFSPPKSFDEQDETIFVTDISISPNESFVAAGYSNGEIVVFDSESKEVVNHFVGHRRQISCIKFSPDSSYLASGALDNDVILWDIAADNGICRFVGHQNAVTDLVFIPNTKWLVSSSKDTHIRVWDLELQTCVQAITTAMSEVWALCYVEMHRHLLCGGKAKEFFVFNVADPDTVDNANPTILSLHSRVHISTPHRVQAIETNIKNSMIAIVSSARSVEFWKVNDQERLQQKIKRKKRRARAKAKAKEENQENEQKTEKNDEQVLNNVDFYEHDLTQTFKAKICALSFVDDSIVVSFANNSIQRLSPEKVEENDKEKNQNKDSYLFKKVYKTHGHKTDIRCAGLTDEQIVTAGEGECRVWDIESGSCVSSIKCGYPFSMAILPGGRFVILGTKSGVIQLVDLSAATVYNEINAHKDTIWSISVSSDSSEIATGSSDREVRFWGLQFDEMDRPVLVHKRTLKMTDEVFSVCYNFDSSLIAVALLDTTVKIFHTDTLNFHLNLYGAQLPVSSVDFSTDNSLLCTASADKNLRIFGTEFGDCHRSLWAHQAAVVSVKFVSGTHLAWTIGRDGNLVLWDCDRFLNVQTLRSHISEIWALAVSKHGQLVVTAGRDKGIRIWTRTNEPLYVSQERELERERRMERDGADRTDRTVAALRGSVLGGAVVDSAARQSVESINHGDLLADAIQNADEGKILVPNMTPSQYVLKAVERINRANIDIVMMSLPFHSSVSLIKWMVEWLKEGKEPELIIRCLCSIIKAHRNQLEASSEVKLLFTEAKTIVHEKVKQMKSRCGMNLAALKLISNEMKST